METSFEKDYVNSVECIIFRKKEDYEFLLLKRIPEKGEFWQPVTGALEEETKLEGAYREVLEETGIEKEMVTRVLEEIHTFKFQATSNLVKEHVFGFEVLPQAEVSIHKNIYPEHSEFVWVNYEKALEMLKWDTNKEAFKKLYSIITE